MATKKKNPESTSALLGRILGEGALSPSLDSISPAGERATKPQRKAVTAEEVLAMNGRMPTRLPDEPRLRQAAMGEVTLPPDLPPAAEKTSGQVQRRPRTVHLADDIYEAIRLREYREAGHMNRSDIVEEALRAYLRVELKELAMTGELRDLSVIAGRAAG